MEALERVLGRDLGVLGAERLVRDVDHRQLVLESLGVAEAQRASPRSVSIPRPPSRSAQ